MRLIFVYNIWIYIYMVYHIHMSDGFYLSYFERPHLFGLLPTSFNQLLVLKHVLGKMVTSFSSAVFFLNTRDRYGDR